MILSSEHKCFHNIGARLYFVDSSSIFEEPSCKISNPWEAGNFSNYLSLTAMALSYTQSGKRTTSGKYSLAVPEYREESSPLTDLHAYFY